MHLLLDIMSALEVSVCGMWYKCMKCKELQVWTVELMISISSCLSTLQPHCNSNETDKNGILKSLK